MLGSHLIYNRKAEKDRYKKIDWQWCNQTPSLHATASVASSFSFCREGELCLVFSIFNLLAVFDYLLVLLFLSVCLAFFLPRSGIYLNILTTYDYVSKAKLTSAQRQTRKQNKMFVFFISMIIKTQAQLRRSSLVCRILPTFMLNSDAWKKEYFVALFFYKQTYWTHFRACRLFMVRCFL